MRRFQLYPVLNGDPLTIITYQRRNVMVGEGFEEVVSDIKVIG